MRRRRGNGRFALGKRRLALAGEERRISGRSEPGASAAPTPKHPKRRVARPSGRASTRQKKAQTSHHPPLGPASIRQEGETHVVYPNLLELAPLDINMLDTSKSGVKSPHTGFYKDTLAAAITQLVEWLAVNQHVTGSSPVGGALYGGIA